MEREHPPAAAASAQAEVRRTMLEAGGYWRPLAAVARLLEELGELVELLVRTGPSPGDLAGELADLWIITAALADQFRIAVPEPQGAPCMKSRDTSAAGLVMAGGQIARVVNYYDGPKTPRSVGALPSLAEAIAGFHMELELLCTALSIDLPAAVREKIAVIHATDMKRFAREDSDPSTSPTLALLAEPWRQARLWGAPAPARGRGAEELVAALGPSLIAFTRAAPAEGLDGYVVAAPARAGSPGLDRWLREFTTALERADPASGTAASTGDEVHFNGLRLRIEVIPLEPRGESVPGAEALVLLAPGDGALPVSPGDDLRGARHD